MNCTIKFASLTATPTGPACAYAPETRHIPRFVKHFSESSGIRRLLSIMFLILMLLLLPIESPDSQFLKVTGSPYEVGKKIGEAMNDSIVAMYELKLKAYEAHLPLWKDLASLSLEGIQKYAPTSHLELQGMSEAPGVTEHMLAMLNTEYEMSMLYGSSKKCSGAYSSKDGRILIGQTDDEDPTIFLGMDGVYTIQRNEESLIFTHPGYLMFMGMNQHKLVVEWFYIDDGTYMWNEPFVPTTVLLREMLTKQSLLEAMEFLTSVPKSIGNCFMVAKSDEGIMTVELSSTNFTAAFSPVSRLPGLSDDVCHTNTIVLSQPMMDHDLDLDPTSRPRYDRCRELMKHYRQEGGIDLIHMKELFDTPPILRNGSFEDIYTLATMVFQPDDLVMNIKYYKDHEFRVYKLGQ